MFDRGRVTTLGVALVAWLALPESSAEAAPSASPDAKVRVHIDTDPENMLPQDQPSRVFHNKVKDDFALHDMLVVGVVNETDPDGDGWGNAGGPGFGDCPFPAAADNCSPVLVAITNINWSCRGTL